MFKKLLNTLLAEIIVKNLILSFIFHNFKKINLIIAKNLILSNFLLSFFY